MNQSVCVYVSRAKYLIIYIYFFLFSFCLLKCSLFQFVVFVRVNFFLVFIQTIVKQKPPNPSN